MCYFDFIRAKMTLCSHNPTVSITFHYISYSHKDKHEQVWEQTQLILGNELSGRRDKTSQREAYQSCSCRMPRAFGWHVLQKEYRALVI